MTIAFEAPGVVLHHGDCIDVMRTLPDASVHAVITDPPYGLEFMGKDWDGADGFRRSLNEADTGRDNAFGRLSRKAPEYRTDSRATAGMMTTGYTDGANRIERPSFLGGLNPKCTTCDRWQRGGNPCTCESPTFTNERLPRLHTFQEWCTEWATEALRVLKPGGHMLAFGGSRTWHRLQSGIEDAGFEIRDSIAWMHGQGFPKSMNVGADPAFCQCPKGESKHDTSGMERRGADDSVRSVRDDREALTESSEAAGQRLLQPLVPSEEDQLGPLAGEQLRRDGCDEDTAIWRGEPRVEGRGDSPSSEGELPTDAHSRVPSGPVEHDARERTDSGAPSGHGPVGWSTVDALGVREPQGSRHVEQRPVEPRSVADEQGSQDGRGRPVCERCGKPDLTGWGTALKPAFEPIVVARKPLVGTVAKNVLEYGTGALNIDATRTAFQSDVDKASAKPQGAATALNGALAGKVQKWSATTATGSSTTASMTDTSANSATASANTADGTARTEFTPNQSDLGRWPTNVILDESQAADLDAQTGVTKSPRGTIARNTALGQLNDDGWTPTPQSFEGYGDSGGASRFFPTFHYEAKAGSAERPAVDGVMHPTVKPLDLMRWLVRLVTPPDGVILEPFAGSGTTLEAALLENFTVIGIEREATYLPLIESRITKPLQPAMFGDWDAA